MAKINEEIGSENYENNFRKLILNIFYTNFWIKNKIAPIFKKHKILDQHYNVLRIVKGRKGEPVSPGEIKKVMLDRNRDLTRLIDKLVKFELLTRKNSIINRRMVEIRITEKGEQLTDSIEEELKSSISEFMNLSEEESHQVSELLDKLRS